MGKWAKRLFGQESFGDIGIVIAGTITKEFEKEILDLFDEVISSKDSAYHAHLVKKNGIAYPVVFNIYGAPAMVDVITEMHDGGCRTILFFGSAYGGFQNLEVGSIVIPEKSYHFDGIYHPIEPDRKLAYADKELKQKLEELFKKNNITYVIGTNISVPAVTFQIPHANEEYQEIKPATVEMELASCYSRAKDIGIRAVGTLIISDNRKSSIGDDTKRELRHKSKIKVLETIINNITYFELPKLSIDKEFNIDEHLASIIEDPEDVTNIYRKN
nr:hypothetical protein [Candidatus Woesearchaeota archaeon]